MTGKEPSLEQLSTFFMPWMVSQSEKNTLMAIRRPFGAAVLEGAIRLTPHLSDERFLSFFEKRLNDLPFPTSEAREFTAQMLLMTKRLLASRDFKKATIKLLNKVCQEQPELLRKRQAFQDKYGFEPPGFIAMSPSMRCNLRCVGCYAGEYSRKDDLGPEIMQKVVNEVRDIGINFIIVIGGEPLFCEDVFDMWAKNQDFSFMFYTNGTLIDEAMAKKLSKLGNVYPCISLEGYEAQTEARRGKGTYARIMTAMENLRREGIPFGFSATVVRSNNELISSDEFVDFLIAKGCSLGWYFNYIPIGREPDLSLMPTPEQRLARYRRLREIRRTKPIVLADFWCDGAIVGGCLAAGRYYLHVLNTGDVEACVFAHFAADNIKEKSLVEILHSPYFEAIRKRQPFSPNLLRPCMVIDNPQVLRQVVAEGGARPSHPGAESIITRLAPALDKYAGDYARLADAEWAKEHSEANASAPCQGGVKVAV